MLWCRWNRSWYDWESTLVNGVVCTTWTTLSMNWGPSYRTRTDLLFVNCPRSRPYCWLRTTSWCRQAWHTVEIAHPLNSIMGVGAQWTLGGTTFLPEKCVWKINKMPEFYTILAWKIIKIPEFVLYLPEKLAKFPNFTWFLPGKCQNFT